jgi:hypothetical protein
MFSFKKSLVAVVSVAMLVGLITFVTPTRTQGQHGDNQQPLNVINTKSTSSLSRDVRKPLRTPLQNLVVSNIGFTDGVRSLVEDLRKPNRGPVVEFPGRDFRTIQEAIDAVPHGGTLKIAPGVYHITEGLFVRDKTVFFEGPGRRDGRTATLVAPRPDRVVPAANAIGVINFINSGGGAKGFEIFGADVSVLISGRSDRSVTIKDMTLAHTGRAILHLAPAHLIVEDSFIHHCKWNGISFAPKNLDLVPFIPQLVVTDTQLIDGDNIGIYVNHGKLEVIDNSLGGWPEGGIAVVNSTALILDNLLIQNGKFGILLWQSQGEVLDATILNTTSANGLFGDGISVWCGGARLSGVEIGNSQRAAISNFDSHIDFEDMTMTCNAIDIDVEIGGLCVGVPPSFTDNGGILCGCPNATGTCIAQTSGPPSFFLVEGLE